MKLKQLEHYLQQLDTFEKPKLEFEQYATPPHIAACMLYTIQTSFDDIEDKLVADLGCGCGILSLGCCMLNAASVIGFDIDKDAIEIARRNALQQDITAFEGVIYDIPSIMEMSTTGKMYFDTVVLNPPFGTRNDRGVDMRFLKAALQLTKQSVYSLHKTSTRSYVLRKANEWLVKAEVLAELRFNLPATYKFHTKPSVDIKVDLFRFSKLINTNRF